MKVRYRNSDTTTIEIETSEEIAVTLTESYRKEDNLARKCRYHHYSYDAIDFEGEEYADPDTPETISDYGVDLSGIQSEHVTQAKEVTA